MKKLTAKVAAKVSAKYNKKPASTFQDVIRMILLAARMGVSNCFIDGEEENLYTIRKELLDRGFKVYIEHINKIAHLVVEW